MNPPQSPHDPDNDPGYEVVDDPGYEVVETPPARPRPSVPPARAIPQAKLIPAKPVPVARPTAKVVEAAPPPKARVVHDDETTEIPRKKTKTKTVRVIDDDDEDDRPRKKKRRPGRVAAAPADDESSSVLMEWAGPGFLMLLGLVLTVVGTWGIAKGPEAMISPMAAIAFRVIGESLSRKFTGNKLVA